MALQEQDKTTPESLVGAFVRDKFFLSHGSDNHGQLAQSFQDGRVIIYQAGKESDSVCFLVGFHGDSNIVVVLAFLRQT